MFGLFWLWEMMLKAAVNILIYVFCAHFNAFYVVELVDKRDTHIQLWQRLTECFPKWFYWLTLLLIVFWWFQFLLTLCIVIKNVVMLWYFIFLMMSNTKHLFICSIGNLDFFFQNTHSGLFVRFLKIGLCPFFLWICNISLYILEMSCLL